MKITLTPSNKVNVALSVLIILIGLILTFVARSWVPLVFMSFLSIVPGFVLTSVVNAAEVISGGRPWDRYSSIHISIALAGIAFVLVGTLSVVERLVWFNSDTPPSIMVAKAYGDRYTANKHRMFKLNCESRGGGPLNLREVGGQIYVRCGDWYPQAYTVSASQKAYVQAEEETRNDPPHMGFIVEKD